MICSMLQIRLLMLIYSVVIVMFVMGLVIMSVFSMMVSSLLRISSYLFWMCLCMWMVNMMWYSLVMISQIVSSRISILVVVSGLSSVSMLKLSDIIVQSSSQLCGMLLLLNIVNRLIRFFISVIMFIVYVSVVVVDRGCRIVISLNIMVIMLYSSMIYQLWFISDSIGERGVVIGSVFCVKGEWVFQCWVMKVLFMVCVCIFRFVVVCCWCFVVCWWLYLVWCWWLLCC